MAERLIKFTTFAHFGSRVLRFSELDQAMPRVTQKMARILSLWPDTSAYSQTLAHRPLEGINNCN